MSARAAVAALDLHARARVLYWLACEEDAGERRTVAEAIAAAVAPGQAARAREGELLARDLPDWGQV